MNRCSVKSNRQIKLIFQKASNRRYFSYFPNVGATTERVLPGSACPGSTG